MKAELRRLHSPDAPDLATYQPLHADEFGLFIQALIGPEGGDGEEAFGFTVCSPAWLANELTRSPETLLWGRGVLVMPRYDYPQISAAVKELCKKATGSTWDDVATFLSRYSLWEFEDYRPANS